MLSKAKTMGKIQDDDKIYSLLKIFVDHHTRRSFTRFHVIGKENIPKDGACIFGCNHCNTLMDALVLLATSRRKKIFIARGDIFKNTHTAKILKNIGILPIFRMRDGIGSVRDKNGDTIDQAVDVIHDEVPLYLFPEAAHRTKHSLRQLSKGIFHIALDANRQFGHEKPVYIVPVGLEYGDYFRFRSTVLVNYGKPINVTEYMREHEGENEAVIMNELKQLLTERMAGLISYIPDDEDYDAIWETTKIRAGRLPLTLKMRLHRNQRFIDKVLKFREKEPEKAKALFEKVNEFTQHRKEEGISVTSVAMRVPFWRTLWKTVMVLLGLPIFLAAAVVSSPIWITASFILKNLKDKAFRNTVNVCTELIMHPLIMAAGVTLLFCLVPWQYAVLGSIFLYYSYVFYFDYCEYVRIWTSDIRWTFNRKLRREFKALGLFKHSKR